MIDGSGCGLVASFVFKTNARRIASWVGSIPMHSRHHPFPKRPALVMTHSSRRALAVALLLAAVPIASAAAQRTDSARVAPVRPRIDTSLIAIPAPPLSPRRAFIYSLLLPGLGQSRLGRPGAGALFVFTESLAIGMLRESTADLREARLFKRDSLEYIGNDPVTGTPVMHRNAYNDELISIRRGHVEDWVAFLIANHLFAGADAYVAAHLWDLPSQVNVSQTPSGTRVSASIQW